MDTIQVAVLEMQRVQPETLPLCDLDASFQSRGRSWSVTKIPAHTGIFPCIFSLFGPNLVNDFRFGYARLNVRQVGLMANVNVAGQLGIPGIPFVRGVNGGKPNFSFSDIRQLGAGRCVPPIEVTNVFTYRDVLRVVQGRHLMKMGVEAFRDAGGTPVGPQILIVNKDKAQSAKRMLRSLCVMPKHGRFLSRLL